MAKVKKKDSNNYTKILITIFVWCIYVGWLVFLSSTALTLINFLIHLLFLSVMIFIYRNDLKKNIKDLKSKKKNILLLILFFIGCLILLVVSNILIELLLKAFGFPEDTGGASSNAIFSLFKVVPFGTLLAIFFTVFFYPIVEELVFRKSLGDVIQNKVLFVIVSSIICWYFQVTLLSPTLLEFIIGIGALLNGIYASIIYIKKKGNVLYTIIPRMLYNVFICVMQLIALNK